MNPVGRNWKTVVLAHSQSIHMSPFKMDETFQDSWKGWDELEMKSSLSTVVATLRCFCDASQIPSR